MASVCCIVRSAAIASMHQGSMAFVFTAENVKRNRHEGFVGGRDKGLEQPDGGTRKWQLNNSKSSNASIAT
jgi:hypothetical protein